MESAHYPAQALGNLIQAFRGGARFDYWGALFMLIPVALQMIAGIWLWRKARIVAIWMTGDSVQDRLDEPEIAPQRANLDQVQAVVLSSLGVWVLLLAVPQVCSTIFQFLLAYIIELSQGRRASFDRAGHVISGNIWIWAFQLLIGLWLIFGARGITQLLRRARGGRANPHVD